MLNIYLTNLGKYNEGFLVGEWLKLPCEEEEIEACLKRIGIGSKDEFGCPYEEYFITDYECDYGLKVGEYSSLSTLNEYAEQYEDLDDGQRLIVKAYLQGVSDNFQEALDHCDDAQIWYGVDSMTDLAERRCDAYGILDPIPDHLKCYFDYKRFGRDLDIEGTFIQIDEGIVEFYNY